eukprot:1065831-Pelagomonas_calceolata.AAC.2
MTAERVATVQAAKCGRWSRQFDPASGPCLSVYALANFDCKFCPTDFVSFNNTLCCEEAFRVAAP